jgi:hypothetical protein
MEKHVRGLLSALRQAVNEAILGSHDVNAALAAIGRTGRCPSLSVDVALGNPSQEEPGNEPSHVQSLPPGELVLAESDEEFLQSLGIAVDMSAEIATKSPLK